MPGREDHARALPAVIQSRPVIIRFMPGNPLAWLPLSPAPNPSNRVACVHIYRATGHGIPQTNPSPDFVTILAHTDASRTKHPAFLRRPGHVWGCGFVVRGSAPFPGVVSLIILD